MDNHLDLAHTAAIIDDLLTTLQATTEDRAVIAGHLAGNKIEFKGIGHDSWVLSTALAQAWSNYAHRARIPARRLLPLLDGACSMVTSTVDNSLIEEILSSADSPPPGPQQISEFLAWLEPNDLWDYETTAQRVKEAWEHYCSIHPVPEPTAEDQTESGSSEPLSRADALTILAGQVRHLVLADVEARDVFDEHPDLAVDDAEQIAELIRASAGRASEDAQLSLAYTALADEAGL